MSAINSDRPLTIVAFYWLGTRWANDGLGAKYITHLFHGVKRNLYMPFKFVCFTNEKMPIMDSEIELRPFDMPSNQGVLPRLWMFSKESGLFGNQVLAIDLDVVIVGDLADIAGYRGDFCTRSKFKKGEEFKLDGDVMSFYACEENEKKFWQPYKNNPQGVIALTGGRERYWFRHVLDNGSGGYNCDRWEKIAPKQIVSYKRHVQSRHNQIPPNARIVSCHGRPRPHEIKADFIAQNWR
jgi:hypothetical protein